MSSGRLSTSFDQMGNQRASPLNFETHSSPAGDGLECPVCWEVFSRPKFSPRSLWCGHTLCKECVLGLPSATLATVPNMALQLPWFISCPWCQWLTLRIMFKGSLKYPCKNFSLLWMVEALEAQGDARSESLFHRDSDVSPLKDQHGSYPPLSPPSAALNRRACRTNLDSGEDGQSESSGEEPCQQDTVGNISEDPVASIWSDPMHLLLQLEGASAQIWKLIKKIPSIIMLVMIIFFVLPFSGCLLIMYFLTSLVFAVPCSAVALASISVADLLLRRILS